MDSIPADLGKRPKPAHLRKSETQVVVEAFLRALGFSWEEARQLGLIYRPPSSSTADLSAYDFTSADRP
jgi:hypothetical protein